MSASTPAAQTPSATAPTAPSSGPALTFLGTGAGCGVPAFFCECPACEEARRDPRARRGDCGVLVRNERTLLLDTPPDLRHQLEREGVRAVDRVLWTHAHFDHLGGLGELEYMVRLVTGAPLPCAASPAARAGILVDHMVPGSKESRIAEAVSARWPGAVLVLGHPFVDIWQAVKPARVGLERWPDVPRGIDIKHGTLEALGWPHADQRDIAMGWKRILSTVRTYRDLEPALLGRVEELIDFVTVPWAQ